MPLWHGCCTELSDQPLDSLAQVSDRSLWSITLTVRHHTRTQLRMSTPDAVLVLLDGERNVHSVEASGDS